MTRTDFNWLDNNYSCDCNRSAVIEKFYPGTFIDSSDDDSEEFLPCGDTIRVVEYQIVRVPANLDEQQTLAEARRMEETE